MSTRMNGIVTIESFFSPPAGTIQRVGVYSRTGGGPVPYTISLVDLNAVEKALQEESSLLHLTGLLAPREKKLFTAFSYPKRKREWLGGRLAAKYAILQLLQISVDPEILPLLSILPHKNGSPLLTSLLSVAEPLPALSISHSDRFAVALAVNAGGCGIDIQHISGQTEQVADRFCNAAEVQLIRDQAPRLTLHESLTLLWSAKEALKKALLHDQPVMFEGVVLHSLRTGRYFSLELRFPGDNGHPAKITAMKLENAMLAYTVVSPSHA